MPENGDFYPEAETLNKHLLISRFSHAHQCTWICIHIMGMVDMEIDKMAAEVVAMGVDVVDMMVDNADEQVAGMVLVGRPTRCSLLFLFGFLF